MSQSSKWTKDKRPWLKDVHEERKQRSFQLGKQTIDALVAEGSSVTLSKIREKSKDIDPDNKCIHPNTVKSNEELYEYYKARSRTFKIQHTNRRTTSQGSFDTVFRRINPERDLTNVRHKYMKMSKAELVERLIQAEQFIAKNHQKWTAKHFEQYQK